MDEDGAGRSSRGTRPSASKAPSGFIKPSDDDDEPASTTAWRKGSTQPNSQGKQEVEKDIAAEKRPQSEPMAQKTSALVEKGHNSKKPTESPSRSDVIICVNYLLFLLIDSC